MTKQKSAHDLNVIGDLINLEARYLNKADLESWISLFTEDGYYWMPLDSGQKNPEEHDSIFYEDRILMEIRKRNFMHRLSPSMQYPIRSSRVISDIHVSDYDEDSCIVESSFHAVILYKEQTVFAGSMQHKLRREGDAYKIQMKRVDLINADMPLPPIMIYL
ncbi:MAG: aromatic-ring-hydroxylating dioxygenase subunit beta [Gammaproteobacteria bacterium]|nr:aromatic-ring-hydroxylating dioxygenase subunit beta [Gammaproteobacteria bacterium]